MYRKKEREERKIRARRAVFFSWCCCCGLFFLYAAVITAVVLIATLGGRQNIRAAEEDSLTFSQTLTQINAVEIRISVVLKNSRDNANFTVNFLTNTLLGGAEMSCLPVIPTTLLSGGGMIMCTNIYTIQPGDSILNATVSVNNGELTRTDEIIVQVFPPEICNRTATQYGQTIISDGITEFTRLSLNADGTVILYTEVRNDQLPRISEYDGASWVPKGDQSTLYPPGISFTSGSAYWAGYLSNDGNTVILSIHYNDGGSRKETVFVLDFVGGVWVQRGQRFSAIGNPRVSGSGNWNQASITPDGNTIAFSLDADIFNGLTNLTSYVYDWDGVAWQIRGEEQHILINYDEYAEPGPREAWEIGISSDGNTYILSYSSALDTGADVINMTAIVFQWDGNAWNIRGQPLFQSVSSDMFIGARIAPPYSAAISSDGNTVFNGRVHDWNSDTQMWDPRPFSPNVQTLQKFLDSRSGECMSYDGRFVASFNETGAFSIYEWKLLQREWVICQSTFKQPAFPRGCAFSRDGMHYALAEVKVFPGGINMNPVETFTFLE